MEKTIYPIGLVIGRFQPFHLGHVYVIHKALQKARTIVIGIGSSNVKGEENPFSYTQRKKMIERFILHEKLQKRVSKIVPLQDFPDDTDWLKNTINRVGVPIDVVVGNNDWVNHIFEKAGYRVFRLGYYRRDTLEGNKIRKLMQEGKQWQDRVPSYLVESIDRKLYE
jgi:nicotinamide-nucleotide adenylyltransferase